MGWAEEGDEGRQEQKEGEMFGQIRGEGEIKKERKKCIGSCQTETLTEKHGQFNYHIILQIP